MTFLQWLTLLFIAFKLDGKIGWSWAFVVAPIFIELILAYVVESYRHKRSHQDISHLLNKQG
jgi:Ca2+/Na+ antiporter